MNTKCENPILKRFLWKFHATDIHIIEELTRFVASLLCIVRSHFLKTQHTYTMELGSQRVWDYAGG